MKSKVKKQSKKVSGKHHFFTTRVQMNVQQLWAAKIKLIKEKT